MFVLVSTNTNIADVNPYLSISIFDGIDTNA
jgi:hypothetical protein